MKPIPKAPRPATISFEDDSNCTFDSNRFIEWKSVPNDSDKSGYVSDIVFMGYPYRSAGYLTELGRVSIFHIEPLDIHHDIINAIYKAQHPWLDLNDALKKGCLERDKDYETLSFNGDHNIHDCVENTLPTVWTVFKDKVECLPMGVVAFKPLCSDKKGWSDCQGVNVWQADDTE
jgi:hypothetical protein